MKKKFLTSFILTLSLLVSCISSSFLTAHAANIVLTDETVSVSDKPENSSLIVAAYDSDNALLGCKIYNGADSVNYTEDLKESLYDAVSIKAFLWNMGNIEPLATAQTLSVTPTPTENPNRVLTVYFSYTNNTESLAKKVQGVTNSDIYEITAKEPYTDEILEYYGDNRAYREQNNKSTRPEISGVPANINDYDVIMLGFPIWYGYAPRVVCTFLESCDLSGKTIMPFCTSGSSGISSGVSEIKTLCPDSTVTSGFRGTASTTDTEIQNWLDTNHFSNAVKKRLKLNVGGNEIIIKLNDSNTANSLVSMLPLTLNFSDFNSTEKIAYLPDTLDTSDAPESFDPSIGDLTLYAPWGNLALFYKDFPNSSGLVPIGKVETGIEYMTSLAGKVTAELY